MPVIHWRTGFEIELLAPAGLSRKDLALRLAQADGGGSIAPVFVPQAELIDLEGVQVFENLTLGYDALDADGKLIARCADDMTIQADLDKQAAPKPGWFRIVGDDARLIRLIKRHADPAAPVEAVLEPIAALFGARLQHFDNGMVRLADSAGAPIAMASHLPSERERPCEIITPPISENHAQRLAALLEPAFAMGFTIPSEAALHVHFDAAPLCTPKSFAKLVVIFDRFGDQLKQLFHTNPRCTRLGKWPDDLLPIVTSPSFADMTWTDARTRLRQLKLTKYVDFNLMNMIYPTDEKHTFEVRILPVETDIDSILNSTALLEGLLRIALEPSVEWPDIATNTLGQLIEKMQIDRAVKQHWRDRTATST